MFSAMPPAQFAVEQACLVVPATIKALYSVASPARLAKLAVFLRLTIRIRSSDSAKVAGVSRC